MMVSAPQPDFKSIGALRRDCSLLPFPIARGTLRHSGMKGDFMHKGSCLCGAVRIEVGLDNLPEADACHCTMCRKWTGHVGVGVEVPRDQVAITGEDNIRWYQSSDKVRRGFCETCGSTLFFDPLDRQKHSWTGVYMGLFDAPTRTQIGLHMFTAEKGDYYDINDDAKQNEY